MGVGVGPVAVPMKRMSGTFVLRLPMPKDEGLKVKPVLEAADGEAAAGRGVEEEEVAVGVRLHGVRVRAAEGDGDAGDADCWRNQ